LNDERTIRIQAELIRRRLEGRVPAYILETITDERLIEMEAEHHRSRVRELETQRRDTTLGKVMARAMDTSGPRVEKRPRWLVRVTQRRKLPY
jgi:hypothetical protein